MKPSDLFTDKIHTDIEHSSDDNHQELDHEVQMARSDLYRSAHSAIKLHNMLKAVSETQGIEGWVAAKITKAADYLESVYHYLDYEMRMSEQVKEAPIMPGTAPAPAAGAAPTATANPAATAALAAQQITAKKKEIQDQIRAKQTEISTLQRQLSAVGTGRLVQSTYESASAGSTSSGGIASTANGFAKGGPGTMTRAKKVKEDPAPDNEETYKVRVKTATAGERLVRVQATNDQEAEDKAMDYSRKKNYNPISAKSEGIYYREAANEGAMTTMSPKGEKPWSPPKDQPKKKYPAIGTIAWENLPKRTKVELLKKRGHDPDEYFGSKKTEEGTMSAAEKSVAEAKGLKKRVRVVKTGETGTIGEVEHGLFKGAPKVFIVDLDKGGNIRATAAELRLIKDKDMAENTGPKFTGYYKGTDKGRPGKKMVGSD